VSVDPAGSHRAVGVASWVRALAVGALSLVGAIVPVLSFVPICTVSAVHAACYLGTVGCVAVALAAWVVALYCRVFVNYF
jgi:VIT1/CCC1 family predicted Fe2+/Mn2+ transporter